MSATLISPNHEIVREDLRKQESGKYLYSDEAAVAIAMRDNDSCDAYLMQTNYAQRWTDSDTLVQSPQSLSAYPQGTTQCNVPNFMLSNAIDAVVPKIVGGLTYEATPFLLRARPGTSGDTIRAKTAIFSYQLEDMNFVQTLEDGIYDMALLGTKFYKWGWHQHSDEVRQFKRKAEPETIVSPGTNYKTVIHTEDSDAIEFELVAHEVHRPYLEGKDLARVKPSPACKSNNIQDSDVVVETGYLDWYGLDKLRDQPDYDIPSKEVLLDWFFRDKKSAKPDNQVMTLPEGMRAYITHATQQNYPTSADPLRASLLFVERQDENSIIVVLCHGSDCILIRNSENPFAKISKEAGGKGHTYLGSVWRKLRDSPYGQGLGQLVGTRQMVAQGTENLALEVLAYQLNPTFTRLSGWNEQTQDISLGTGTVIKVDGDDVKKGIGLLEMPKVGTEPWQAVQYNKSEALEAAGVSQQFGMGASGAAGTVTGARSGSGAQAVDRAQSSRLDSPIERFIRQVFEPFLYIMDNLNNLLLPSQQIREILAERAPKYQAIDHVTFRNAKMEYEVLAGAHLGPKREMTQFLAAIEQIAINPQLLQAAAEAGKKFNFSEWFKTYSQLAGFEFSQEFFVDMTADELKRRDANSAAGIAAQKAQASQQQLQAQNAAKTSQIFDGGLARAGEKVTVLQAEHALQLGQETLGSESLG